MKRGAVYVLVTAVVAVSAGVLVFMSVASASPAELGPSVVVPSEPTAPGSPSDSKGGASPVPGPSPSTAGGEDDDDDDGPDDADDDFDD